jgi:hypothetical protein
MKWWAEIDQGDVVTKRDEKKYDSKISWNHESMCFGWFRAFVAVDDSPMILPPFICFTAARLKVPLP